MSFLRTSLMLGLIGMTSPALAQSSRDPHPDTNFVAVVVGLSVYDQLPSDIGLNFARSDAATVASALQDGAAFDYVFLLTDNKAKKADITEILRERVAQLVGPHDVLVFYFVGHGLGADLGLPTLLAYDSTVADGQQDGFPTDTFATDLATWTRAGTTLIVTDAIHKNQLDGVYFYGPAANQWSNLGPNTLVISSSEASKPAGDGVFGLIFADAVSGAADADADGAITFAELREYLTTRMTDGEQHPVFAGSGSEGSIIAQGVTPGRTLRSTQPDMSMVFGDHEIYAAKFVFRDGSSPTVTCRDEPTAVCDATCYIHTFKAGPCKLSALVDGNQVSGVTLAMVPGRYDCGLRADQTLACIPPQLSTPTSAEPTPAPKK